MKSKKELTDENNVFPLYTLPVDIFIEVACHLDAYSLCYLFLTQKNNARPNAHLQFFDQLTTSWDKQFAPYNNLNLNDKRLFILATTQNNLSILKSERINFDEKKLEMKDSTGTSLIQLIRKANNPQLNDYIFTTYLQPKV